jgi:RNAse (barnase) inhibitor barstar
MTIFTIDCETLNSEVGFWDMYVATTNPGGAGYFGHNLHAFWDGLNGGPGWPGECELRFINTSNIQSLSEGKFYAALKEIARDSKFVRVHVE